MQPSAWAGLHIRGCVRTAAPALATRFARSASTGSEAAKTAASVGAITCVVKGNPATGQLGNDVNCHRILLMLHQKGIPHQLILVDQNNRNVPQWLERDNSGKVPVLKVPADNVEANDSDCIAEYLETKFPSPSMASSAPRGIDAKVFPALYGFMQSSGGEEERHARAALLAELEPVNEYLAAPGKGPLFGGKTLDATDASFAPKLYHIVVAMPHFKGYMLPLGLSALWRYMAWVQTLPAWRACDYGAAELIKGWAKHH